ncbi:hypothetical protein BS50DRAFT_63433 [Corynespora cassiicola Philippines]|uniref:Uncharacterized protein n=1 Tax=Corynespora cassiicola Philippines TaxID=1448308 RepID=A0A2T2NKP8_CORCC|nr:hypothetical protein BS50DRAFT_63433 [Corynespora cassiicola Philippines]
MVPDTLPPHRHLSSTPISLSAASSLLETYLANSESHPHLHPDALITPTGVTFSSHGGPTGGVVMHNLRRVAAGLRGEFLEPEATPEPEEGEAGADDEEGGSGKKGKKGKKGKTVDVEADPDWQNMSEYERDEGHVEVGEVGDRVAFVGEGGEEPEKVDKAARKKAKKERQKEFQREKGKKKADDDEE